MKKGATFKENIEFLISMYKRDLEHEEEYTMEEIEQFKNVIVELETILELSV